MSMNKKSLLILGNIIFFYFIFSNLYSNDKHERLLDLLESNYPAEIFFKQVNKESYSEGWMIIEGKGKARIEFSPPNDILIVANGEWLIFYDPALDRTTYLPLNSGLLEALLDPKSFKKRKDFTVREFIEKDKIVFSILFNIDNKKQEVMIFFNENNLSLSGWKIIENANEEIHVQITSLKKINNKDLLIQNIFSFKEESKGKSILYYGPYKRKIKKIQGNGKLN